MIELNTMPVAYSRISLLVRRFNQAITVGNVVRESNVTMLPVDILMFDNNSTDSITECAFDVDTIMCRVPPQKKGNVIFRIFADANADVFVLEDASPSKPNTYLAYSKSVFSRRISK